MAILCGLQPMQPGRTRTGWRARRLQALVGLGLVGGLAGCVSTGPVLQAGLSEPEVLARMSPLTGRHALPGGGTRLEFARGPMGRTTWMVDLDAQGRALRWAQVLDNAHFAQVVDGMPREDLLRLLGRPAHRAGEWQNRETWYWRYPTTECLWYAVTLSAEGRVMNGGGDMPDPSCDRKDHGGWR